MRLFDGRPVPAAAWRMLPIWLGIAFALRAAVALHGDFFIHADEIAQYLEPAHWLAFGYGVLPLEFFYGARSWLIPGLAAALLRLCEAVGLGEPSFYIGAVKLMFCLLSLLIPWGVYHYSRSILSEPAARLALIFACVWPHLIVYAHKPLTEFIATDLFMAALGLAVPAGRRNLAAVGVGLLLALTALIRMQFAPVALGLWLARIVSLPRYAQLAMVGGSTAAVALVGLLEWFSWGGFFTSYFNNLRLNVNLEHILPPSEGHFYLPRLLYATGGGALLALWMLARHPKSYLLLSLCLLAILLPHMFALENKQFRFVALALVLALIPMAGWFGMHIHAAQAKFSQAGPTLLASIFSVLVLSHALPYEKWLHWSLDGRISGGYLHGQNKLFAVYRYLAEQNDVTGVVDYSNLYLQAPRYYYLHRQVPLYDRAHARQISASHGISLGQQASHVISDGKHSWDQRDFQPWKQIGGYTIYRYSGNNAVSYWKDYTVWAVSPRQFIVSGSFLKNYRAFPSITLQDKTQ